MLFTLILGSCNNSKSGNNIVNSNLKINPDLYNVGFLIMNGTCNTELMAPFSIFQHTQYQKNIKAMNVFTVANTLAPITTSEGLLILPDFDYTQSNLPDIDILVVPSVEHPLNAALEDVVMLSFVKKVNEKALFILSHGHGAFILAQAGVLDTVVSTTFPSSIDLYKKKFPNLNVKKKAFFVHDGKYLTSSGGAKSFEAALYLCELLYGKKVAHSLAEGVAIDWEAHKVPHFIAP